MKEAAHAIGKSADWMYRHADTLPFTVHIGRSLRFSRLGLQRELATNTFVRKSERRLTFEELATSYLKHYERTGLRSGDTACYRVRNLRRFFATDRASDITTARIIAYQDFRREDGAAHGTINR